MGNQLPVNQEGAVQSGGGRTSKVSAQSLSVFGSGRGQGHCQGWLSYGSKSVANIESNLPVVGSRSQGFINFTDLCRNLKQNNVSVKCQRQGCPQILASLKGIKNKTTFE